MKNYFKALSYIEEIILDENDAVVGAIRVKPSTILMETWKW